ncbi:MAG: KilA-N domain-containing protein [Odoribacter sp.]|nr:KilA-N domain-containing protein [Odoribacter sp.]
MSPSRWVEITNAIGIVVKNGANGGTYAQRDIAFKFASWVSVEFELYLIKEFQRLKAQEQVQLGWSAKRELSKINYRIHTDFIDGGISQGERLVKLNRIAIQQMRILEEDSNRALLK